jgi:hypothetical protein
MKTKNILSLCISIILFLANPIKTLAYNTFWEVQSIDTVKYSRDLAREKASDPAFISTINSQVQKIKQLGATHIAIGTPYDSEFIPFLRLWVDSSHKAGLNVWFRGNFAGWEGWFNYSPITPKDHITKTAEFIEGNSELFKDGDIFTPCTECENGTIGDPRKTGNIEGFRDFLINEYQQTQKAFSKIGKKVTVGFYSMNGDVAKLIMDKKTTQAIGGVVVVDHYVKYPSVLADDVKTIVQNSGGKVILGEIGAPIPDVHGSMNAIQQNNWLKEALNLLSQNPNVIGLNYWVLEGGSTQIWPNSDKRTAADTLREYFFPPAFKGVVTDEIDKPISNASIYVNKKTWRTNNNGEFDVPLIPSASQILVKKEGYQEVSLDPNPEKEVKIVLKRTKDGLIFSIQKMFFKLTKVFRK